MKSTTTKRRESKRKTRELKKQLLQEEQSDPRFPRPMGLTHECLQLNNLPPDQKQEKVLIKNRIKKRLIGEYISNGFRLNNKVIPIQQFAYIIQEPVPKLLRELYKGEILMAGLNADFSDIQKQGRVLLGMGISWTLNDRAAVLQQTELLREAQGDSYKPFISAELGKNLKTQLDSQKTIIEIYKAIHQSAGVAIQINQGLSESKSESDSNNLTLDAAIEILDTKLGNQNTTENVAKLKAEYADEDLPEIHALSQGSYQEVKTGLSLSQIKDEQIRIDNHLSRREDDGPIEPTTATAEDS